MNAMQSTAMKRGAEMKQGFELRHSSSYVSPLFIGLELLQAKDIFNLKDNRVHQFSSAMLQQEGTQRSRVGSQPFANPRQAEQMNCDWTNRIDSRSWTLSMLRWATARSSRIEGSRYDALRPKGRLRRDMRNRTFDVS